ncbi:MAG: DUF2461 domain-containing protein [Flavobacterium sp.]|nr:MAG: DUF2461 domain-containing protein [Flavobacterium sp.]
MISKKTLQFQADLKKNNNREWFTSNKAQYEQYKKDYYELAGEFLAEMQKRDESLAQIELKDCVFRINRDIRFSKDKTPYKTNLAIWMSPGHKNTNLAGYYVHIEKGASFIAGGVYWPEAADLKKIRKEIEFFNDELQQILSDKHFKTVFGDLNRSEEVSLKTAPKGFEKDSPAIENLKLKCFTASHKIDDKLLGEKDFVKKTCEMLLALKPLNEFLNRALNS